MGEATVLDLDAQQTIQRELMNGETLLWSGRPLRHIYFRDADWFQIPFSFLWGGFAVFWEWGVLGSPRSLSAAQGTNLVFALWGIPFILAGQYFIWGRFLYELWKKARVSYALTSRRVLVLVEGRASKVIEGSLRTLDSLDLSVRKDNTGTISFVGPRNVASSWMTAGKRRNSMGIDLESLVFFDIPDARRVYELIRDQRERLTQASS